MAVGSADFLDLRRDLGVPSAGHVGIQMMLHLVTEVPTDHMEERATVDVCRTDELAQIPLTTGLVLGFFLLKV
jgi:hypothetical protein